MAKDCAGRHERTVRRVAGGVVLASALAAHFIHPGWIWAAAFVGANLLQSSFTGCCPLEIILERADRKRGGVAA